MSQVYHNASYDAMTVDSPVATNGHTRIENKVIPYHTIPDIDTSMVLSCLDEGEYGDAKLFSLMFRGACVLDTNENKWYIWQGHYWKEDKSRSIYHCISSLLPAEYTRVTLLLHKDIYKLKMSIELAESKEQRLEIQSKIDAINNRIDTLTGRSHALRYMKRARNVLSYIGSFDDMSVTSDIWDKDVWTLGTKDGVIDLRSGKMRDGIPSEYIRTIISATWKGIDQQCPQFIQFLHDILVGDGKHYRAPHEIDELVHFLQLTLGYGVTGIVKEHIFLALLGDEGRNGKDTLISTIKSVLGRASDPISNDVLIATPKSTSPGAAKPHLADLQGKRIAWASETDRGERFSVAQVKFITGGGDIPARKVYGQPYVFAPTHLLILLTNNRPHAPSSDKAFWERICPISFWQRYVSKPDPSKSNEHLPDRLLGNKLEHESSGILAWLVRGCLEWQKSGMHIPECILDERAEYTREENLLQIFIDESCVLDTSCKVQGQALYSEYVSWCDENRHKSVMTGTVFGREISKMYTKKRETGGNYYYGIGTRSAYPAIADMQDIEYQRREEEHIHVPTTQEAVHVEVETVQHDEHVEAETTDTQEGYIDRYPNVRVIEKQTCPICHKQDKVRHTCGTYKCDRCNALLPEY